MKQTLFFLIIVYNAVLINGQDINNVPLHHMQLEHGRKEIRIPDIPGYKTLKCDFHMHTIFSDGMVWPEVRVYEAWEEGLDAISITDHIENHPSKKYIGGDHNASYELSIQKAEELGIIFIHGAEITRGMPPGHLNGLFLQDVNPLDTTTAFQAIETAVKQGAFLQWNHPGWKPQQPDSCKWWPEHEELFTNGWMHGIEVFNHNEWYPVALDWCLDKNLAVMANSDIHGVSSHCYDVENGHRPMTLVFSKEKSIEGIKNAMFERRTVAYFDDKLAGKEEFLKAIFDASIQIYQVSSNSKGQTVYAVKNLSDISYLLETEENKTIKLLADRTVLIYLPSDIKEKKVTIKNLFIRSDKNLETIISLKK